MTEFKIEELQSERRSLNGVKSIKERERDDWSCKLRDMDRTTPAYQVVEQDIVNNQNDIIDIEADVSKITAKLRNSEKIKLSKDEFLNLANTAYDKVLAGSPVEKDILLRKLCLNLFLDNKRTPIFIWREPFATLIKLQQSSFGTRERT